MLGTKALAGAERIRSWRMADPTCKIVVFASKMELLDKFCAALIFNALQPCVGGIYWDVEKYGAYVHSSRFFSGESYAKVSPWQPRRQRNQTLKRFREDPNCICLMLQTRVC